MTDAAWELYDSLLKTAHRQGRRIEELEARIARLEQRGAVTAEAQSFAERPVLRLSEPDQAHLCQACGRFHSPELPCVTPADEAWEIFGTEAQP